MININCVCGGGDFFLALKEVMNHWVRQMNKNMTEKQTHRSYFWVLKVLIYIMQRKSSIN